MGLYIMITIVIGVVCTVGLYCYFDYKKSQLEFEKTSGEQTTKISIKALELEIEKENTKQVEKDADAFKEKEKTKQYEIKTNYRGKYNERLY